MGKTRLSNGMRDTMIDFAFRQADCEPERLDEEMAHNQLHKQIVVFAATVPFSEMLVLRKYNATTIAHMMDVKDHPGVTEFRFVMQDMRKEPPPNSYNRRYGRDYPDLDKSRGLEFPESMCRGNELKMIDSPRMIADWVEARSAHRKARNDAMRDVRSFIRGARTYEDVLEFWPAVKEIADKLGVDREINEALRSRMRKTLDIKPQQTDPAEA